MAHGAVLNKETDTSNLLPLDGSKAMTGNLNMTDQGIIDVTLLSSQYSMQLNTTSDSDSFTLSIVKGTTNPNQIVLTNNVTTFSRPIAMNDNKIIGLADGTSDTDAATVGQLNAVVASSGPQYDHPTGNTYIDFYGLSIWVKQNISPMGFIFDTNEQNCFTTLYKYLTGNDPTVSSAISYRSIVPSEVQKDPRNWRLTVRFNENNQWYLYNILSQNNPKFMYLYSAT